MVVSHARAAARIRVGAATDGAVAKEAARRKHTRYPPDEVPRAKLVAFSLETGGRWDEATLRFLKRAAGRAAVRHPGLAALGGQGEAVVYQSWLSQLSCALHKSNVACLRAAGAGGRAPAPGVPTAVGGWPEPEDAAGAGWMKEAIEELLLQAAAAAGVES